MAGKEQGGPKGRLGSCSCSIRHAPWRDIGSEPKPPRHGSHGWRHGRTNGCAQRRSSTSMHTVDRPHQK